MRLMCDKKHEYYFLQGCVGKRVLKHLEAKFERSLGFEGSAKNTFGLFRFRNNDGGVIHISGSAGPGSGPVRVVPQDGGGR